VTTPAGPDILAIIEANPKLQPLTKIKYCQVVRRFFETGQSLADPDALASFAADLPKSSRAALKAAVRLWGDGVALRAKAGATPDNVGAVQATAYRIEALNEAIQVEASKGSKAHTWLTQAEVKRRRDSVDQTTPAGQRDRLLLGLLVGAGL